MTVFNFARYLVNTERRQHARLLDPLPVIIRSLKRGGKSFEFNSVTRDIGAGGLRAVAPCPLHPGEKINLHIRFAKPGSSPPLAPLVSARAVVLRAEEEPDGTCVFAAGFLWRHSH
jgi:hypothetical protein